MPRQSSLEGSGAGPRLDIDPAVLQTRQNSSSGKQIRDRSARELLDPPNDEHVSGEAMDSNGFDILQGGQEPMQPAARVLLAASCGHRRLFERLRVCEFLFAHWVAADMSSELGPQALWCNTARLLSGLMQIKTEAAHRTTTHKVKPPYPPCTGFWEVTPNTTTGLRTFRRPSTSIARHMTAS